MLRLVKFDEPADGTAGGAAAGGVAAAAAAGAGGDAGGAVRPPWELAKGKALIKAALKARPRAAFEHPEEFDRDTEAMLEDELARRTSPGQRVDEEAAAAVTWIDYDEYIRQCDEYEKMMDKDKVRRTPGQSERLYGDP